jgi:hypothetical protein
MVSVIKAFEQRGHCKPSHRIGPVPRHFGERREDEPALPEPGMRDDQPRRTVDHLASVENQIEVPRPRRAGMRTGPAELLLEGQQMAVPGQNGRARRGIPDILRSRMDCDVNVT